jgi:hypothetical protein
MDTASIKEDVTQDCDIYYKVATGYLTSRLIGNNPEKLER